MIEPVLVLGSGRYLTIDGAIIRGRTIPAVEVEFGRSLDADFDAETAAAPGDPVTLTGANRAYWEGIARTGGHSLADLIG